MGGPGKKIPKALCIHHPRLCLAHSRLLSGQERGHHARSQGEGGRTPQHAAPKILPNQGNWKVIAITKGGNGQRLRYAYLAQVDSSSPQAQMTLL